MTEATLAGGVPRTARVASNLREILAAQITRDLKDPRVLGVTVTDVEVTGDLREARVFFSVPGGEKAERAAAAGLQSAAGWLRRVLGEQLALRVTPSLSFRVDHSYEQGARIDAALERLGLGAAASDAPDDDHDDD